LGGFQMKERLSWFKKNSSMVLLGVLGVINITSADFLEDLKRKNIDLNMVLTGDYFYTFHRNQKIEGVDNYKESFSYSIFAGIYKSASSNSPLGFGFSFGEAWFPVVGIEPFPKPDDINGAFSDSNNNFGIFEAYGEVKFSSFTLKIGRFATNIGGEAPFTWQNINIQRGLVWYGEPVFFDGIRVSTEVKKFEIYVGVNDRDTDDGKLAVEGGISYSLGKISTSINLLIPDTQDQWNTRTINLTVNINNFEKLPLTFYMDYLDTPQEGDNANSYGLALLGEYKFNKKISFGGRVEYIKNDGDGDNYGIGVGNNAWTLTITPKYQFNKHFYIRAEGSYVKLGKDVYIDDDGNPTDKEIRLGTEIGLMF